MWTYICLLQLLCITGIYDILCAAQNDGAKPNEFKIINVDVIESSRHINFTFDVKPINKTATIISFDANIEPGISFDQVFSRMSLFKKDADNEYKIYFINNFTIDICKGLDKIAQLPPMMKIAELKEVSNVLHPCPFEGHLFVKDFIIETGNFPMIIPSGQYKAEYYSYNKKSDDSRHLLFHVRSEFEAINNGGTGSPVSNMNNIMKLVKHLSSP